MPINESREAADSVLAKNRPNVFKLIRQIHLYLGTFFAPAILFFSFSGAFQLFSLHESHPGSTYQPPVWIEKMAQIHKDQTLSKPPKRPPMNGAEAKPIQRRPPSTPAGPPRGFVSPLALKMFFLLMAVGLITTTCLGIYMAFKFNRSRRVVWGLLISGTLLPVLFLML